MDLFSFVNVEQFLGSLFCVLVWLLALEYFLLWFDVVWRLVRVGVERFLRAAFRQSQNTIGKEEASCFHWPRHGVHAHF